MPINSRLLRGLAVPAGLIAIWQAAVTLFSPEPFLLPSPLQVAGALLSQWRYLFDNALVTFIEMLAGLLLGAVLGVAMALAMAWSPTLKRFLLPPVVASQTLPVFAIAPLLVLWFGFGVGSKVAMAAIIIFFPVASAFLDGLSSINREWLDLARSWGAGRFATMAKIAVPAALPSLAAGLKIAATVAPIGAVVGEWAGASGGLGYVMLQANARMQTHTVFASLLILAVLAFGLRATVASLADRIVFWRGRQS